MARVLIIEDDTKTANAIREGLQIEGYEAVAVNTGADGVLALEASSFDVVILDWMLPKYSGIEILKDLRGNGIRIPVPGALGRMMPRLLAKTSPLEIRSNFGSHFEC